jgi:hypothetical protein
LRIFIVNFSNRAIEIGRCAEIRRPSYSRRQISRKATSHRYHDTVPDRSEATEPIKARHREFQSEPEADVA